MAGVFTDFFGAVDGLASVVEELVEKPTARRAREITLRSIRVRDAPALAELLGVYRREAVRRREVPQLSAICNERWFGDLIGAAGLLVLLALLTEPCTSQYRIK